MLDEFRSTLDTLDAQIVDALGQRLAVCREIAGYKKAHGIPMMQPHRVEAVTRRYEERGEQAGLRREFMRALVTLIIEESCRIEDEIIGVTAEPATDRAEGSGTP